MTIIIENYRNAKFNETVVNDHRRITCEIEHPTHGWIPFNLCKYDSESDIDVVNLYEKIIADGSAAAYIFPSEDELLAEATNDARLQRKMLLETVVDPIISNPFRWGDLSTEAQNRLTTYRQSLLDITDQSGFPYNITWPTY